MPLPIIHNRTLITKLFGLDEAEVTRPKDNVDVFKLAGAVSYSKLRPRLR